MRALCLLALASSCATGAVAVQVSREDSPERPGRVAVERALPRLAERNAFWIEEHGCTSCHQVPFLLWALNDARDAGFEVDARVPEWNRWSVARVLANTDGDGRAGVARQRTDETWELLLAGSAADTEDPEATRDALGALLADARRDDGTWTAGGQLPDQRRAPEETHDVTTLWSLFALRRSGAPREGGPALGESATVEHLALRFLATRADAPLRELLAAQNPDGGWPWLLTEPSDAMGTGQALYALSEDVPEEHRGAIERAHAFLFRTQGPDGSWSVPSTLAGKGREAYDVSDDWGAAWAVIGLVRTLSE